MLVVDLVVFLISCIILVKSGDLIIKSLIKLGAFLRLSEFVISFMLMSVATTLPELFVGISSALKNNTALSLGNVIGSNIVNMTLIIAIPILLSNGIKIESKEIRKDAIYMFVISLIPIIFMLDKEISRIEGGILVMIFVFYMVKLIGSKRERKPIDNVKWTESFANFGLFFLGILFLIISSDFVVKYGSKLALELFIPPIFIGLSMIALGTSLPELIFGMRAALAKHPIMPVGNIIGSVVINSTLVLGVTALIRPITSDFVLFLVSAIFLIIISYTFLMFLRSEKKLTLKEGVILIIIYIVFLFIEFNLKQIIFLLS